MWKAESCRHAASSRGLQEFVILGIVSIARAAEAFEACMIAIAVSLFGAIAGREAMTAVIARDHRHCSMALDSCSEGRRLGSYKWDGFRIHQDLHLTPRGPEVSRSRTWGGSNFSCCLACL